MAAAERIPVTVFTDEDIQVDVRWDADDAAQVLRWAAAGEHGRVMVGGV